MWTVTAVVSNGGRAVTVVCDRDKWVKRCVRQGGECNSSV